MEWNELEKVKKGNYAEDLVKNFFVSEGYHVYSLYNEEAHPFDLFINYRPEKIIRMVDVKAKARLEFKNATGIDVKFYEEYLEYSKLYQMDFFLCFVDDKERRIYGATIEHLDRCGMPYQLEGMIYWHLDCMSTLRELTDVEVWQLSKYNSRNPEYDGENSKEKYFSELQAKYRELKK